MYALEFKEKLSIYQANAVYKLGKSTNVVESNRIDQFVADLTEKSETIDNKIVQMEKEREVILVEESNALKAASDAHNHYLDSLKSKIKELDCLYDKYLISEMDIEEVKVELFKSYSTYLKLKNLKLYLTMLRYVKLYEENISVKNISDMQTILRDTLEVMDHDTKLATILNLQSHLKEIIFKIMNALQTFIINRLSSVLKKHGFPVTESTLVTYQSYFTLTKVPAEIKSLVDGWNQLAHHNLVKLGLNTSLSNAFTLNVVKRFKYHFSGKKTTNNQNDPSFMFSFLLKLFEDNEMPFQYIIKCLNMKTQVSYEDFIEIVLQEALRPKLIKILSKHNMLFSKYIPEILSFDEKLTSFLTHKSDTSVFSMLYKEEVVFEQWKLYERLLVSEVFAQKSTDEFLNFLSKRMNILCRLPNKKHLSLLKTSQFVIFNELVKKNNSLCQKKEFEVRDAIMALNELEKIIKWMKSLDNYINTLESLRHAQERVIRKVANYLLEDVKLVFQQNEIFGKAINFVTFNDKYTLISTLTNNDKVQNLIQDKVVHFVERFVIEDIIEGSPITTKKIELINIIIKNLSNTLNLKKLNEINQLISLPRQQINSLVSLIEEEIDHDPSNLKVTIEQSFSIVYLKPYEILNFCLSIDSD